MGIIEDLKKLVEFESPSEDLDACRGIVGLAVQIANENLKPEAQLIEENNRPVFWWGSKNPKVVLLGHLDTVWPKGSYVPTWSVSGDIAKGPGIFDMKAGFLQAIYAVKEIPDAELKVAIIATTDEELGSQSSRALIERVSKSASAVLVLEASLNGKVKTGRKGTSMYQIALHGRASHAGLEPEKGINATTEIAAIVIEVAKLANPEFGTTVVPTVMHSGTTTNTVPAIATLDIDIRSFSTAELIRIDLAMKKLSASHPEAKLEVTGGINRPPLETTATTELYEILEKVAREIGMEPVGQASVGGASDGNFAAAAGARVLDGLGAVGDGAHAPHEQILLSSIPSRVKLLTAFIKELIRD
ncbi:MAG: M20/M25/M40 family metallo-hydrolase [Actinomycetes bacterium]